MSDREIIYQLLDTIPDSKISYVIGYIQGLMAEEAEEPNAETIEAFKEVDDMKRTGNGQHFNGSTKDFLNMLLEDW